MASMNFKLPWQRPKPETQNYTLIRSNRRSLSLEVTRDLEVIVRAPTKCSQAEIDNFLARHENWLKLHMERQAARQAAHPPLTEEEKQALFQKASREIPLRVKFFADIMGLSPLGIKITAAEKRFGSCSGKNRLCFSYRLAAYPPEAVDYVVVHELAHMVHKNHGPNFYALVAEILPDYKSRVAILKQ